MRKEARLNGSSLGGQREFQWRYTSEVSNSKCPDGPENGDRLLFHDFLFKYSPFRNSGIVVTARLL
jgi:hypothetical protein